MQIILASASPRRQQMLAELNVAFKIRVPGIDESRLRGEPAHLYVQRVAREKAESVRSKAEHALSGDWAVLAADTIVVLGKQVLGKPTTPNEAIKTLTKLSGKTHEVITAFHWVGRCSGEPRSSSGHVRTKVTFADAPPEFWKWYVSTGEPMDKAGSYAAQGIGMSFIEKVSGSYSNVVGLPLPQVLKAFTKAFGKDLRESSPAYR